jgi:zona occludens toxin
MIDLITGLPGNSKTLYTIAWVRDWAKREGRPVFYSGIPLSDEGKAELGWMEIDPEKWMEAPPKAIVVIDECQRVFRNRSINSQPPKYVTELETHRHLGIDLVFITQHPMLIDPAIRRLTGRHRHIVRIWGLEASTVHEWPAVRDNCDKPPSRKDSEKAKWKFDKSVYRLYKSAEAHTGKRMIPMRAKLLVLVPVLLGLAAWYVYGFMQKKAQPEAANGPLVKSVTGTPVGSSGASSSTANKPFDPVADAKQYVAMNTARVQGLPHTAPKFDEITKPQVAPVPVACLATQSRCLCYTQQGTRMDVRDQVCRDIAEFGFFQEFDPAGRDKRQASVAVLDREDKALPISGASTKETAPVYVMERDGYGVLGKKPGA